MIETAMDRLQMVLERIAKAARQTGRKPENITLVAVTKKVPFERVLPFLEAGLQDVGENRVQEALEKYAASEVKGNIPRIHLIGPLQSNKARKAVEFFDLIQTLDRWELAEDLSRHAQSLGKTLDCLAQVKISDEPTKSGLDPAALIDFVPRVSALPNLRLRGLMGIPPLAAQGEAARPYFQRLRRLFESASGLRSSGFDTLSMGMSSDFEAAIAEGSTMVRLGTLLFGQRPTFPST